MADSPVQEGDILAGKYRVERVLGEGGMGVVVAAWHIELEQRVAMKFLLPELAERGDAAERFRREARAAVRIKSEHVARVLDVGTLEEGVPYMVMEFLDGHDLSQELSKRGSLEVGEAVEFVLQACEAIAEAHSVGIVHRDLKPANLFVTERADGSRVIKVLDFGISKSLTGAGGDMSLTRTAAIIGSPLYMSPEQMDSAKDVDQRTDIWALGVILFELIAGRPPYTGNSIPQLCAAILNDDPPSLTDFRPDVGLALSVAVQKCLQKKLEKRFSTVGELVEAVGGFGPPGSQVSVDRVQRVLGRSASGTTGPIPALSTAELSGARTVPSSPGLISSPNINVIAIPAEATSAESSGHTVASWGRTGTGSEVPKRRAPLMLGGGLLALLLGGGALWAVGTSGAHAEPSVAGAPTDVPVETAVPAQKEPEVAPAVDPPAAAVTPPSSASAGAAPEPSAAPVPTPAKPASHTKPKPVAKPVAKPAATTKPTATSPGLTDFGGRN